MFRTAWKTLLIGAVAAAILAGGAMKVDAFWSWGCYRPAVYSCHYAVPYHTASYCFDPCGYTTCGYYLGYRPGPLRRLLFGRYRWYYGCWTTPSVSYSVCYSPVMVSEATPTVSPEPRPAAPPADPVRPPADPVPPPEDPGPPPADPEPAVPEPAIIPQPQEIPEPAEPMPGVTPENAEPALPPAAAPGFDFNPLEPRRPDSTYVPKPENSGLISVWVPHGARVIVNGHVTESKGSRRQFVSYGLQPGYSYKYEIKAQVVRDGKIIEDVRTITLTAGQDVAVAFGFQSLPSQTLAAQW